MSDVIEQIEKILKSLEGKEMSDTGWKIIGSIEGEDSPLFRTIARNTEDVLNWIHSILVNGDISRIVIVTEDRLIRDCRRDAGIDPDVEIEGPPGFRYVKSVSPLTCPKHPKSPACPDVSRPDKEYPLCPECRE